MSHEIDRKITSFIGRHHVLTLATQHWGQPWCANMFYAWSDAGYFVFTSDEATRHIDEAKSDDRVAASIVLETKVVGRLQGLQVEGRLMRVAGSPEESRARASYLRKFPFAAVADLNLWILAPTLMKFTDNTLGFGKKIIWEAKRQDPSYSM